MAKAPDVPFDYCAWRVRMGWDPRQAAEALGVSRTYYWKAEKHSMASRMCAWAAYGLEMFQREQQLAQNKGKTVQSDQVEGQ